ncbi:MAG: GerMN domain-containing protein [Clostridia bacterium]|nr:GerMN domain-containing protein [Clostridia bacterium]
MKRRILLLLLAGLFLLGGCGPAGKDGKNPLEQKQVVLYFANGTSTDLIAVNLDVEDVDREELPSFVLEKLLEGPADESLKPSVRTGTSLLSFRAEQGLAKVDLSREFYHEESIYDVLALSAVVKSLTSIRGIDRVMVTVEGEPIKKDDGEVYGILKGSDVVFDADALAEDESNVTLYFSDLNAEYLVREIRRIKVPRGDSMEKLVLAELINGPKSQNGARVIPAETKILSVETKESICFINLSEEFVTKNNVGTSAERLTVFSIVNSLTELSNIDKVQFLIEGEKRDVYHHMVFNEPIERDISMIQK